MKKQQLAEHAAKLTGVAPGAAADQVDKAVNRILRALKNGQSARLPGVGTITPSPDAPGKRWVFERESHER